MTRYAHGFVLTATLPTAPDVDDMVYDKTNDVWVRWNGTAWINTTLSTDVVSADHTLLGWSGDVGTWTTNTALVSGQMMFARARMHRSGTIGHVVYATSVTATLLTYAAIGVYSLAGVQLGVTADMSATLMASNIPAGTPVALGSATPSLAAGTEVFVAVLAVGTGTMPTFRSAGVAATMNYGMTAAGGLRAGLQAGLAALPAPITLASTSINNSHIGFGLAA